MKQIFSIPYPLIIIVVSIIIIPIGFMAYINAQTPNEDKTFERCNIDTSELDRQNLSYDVHCNTDVIIIHGYERISILDRQLINSSLTSQGFIDIPITVSVGESK